MALGIRAWGLGVALFVALIFPMPNAYSPMPVRAAQAAPAPESFAPLVERLTPAVVNISTTQKIVAQGGMQGLPPLMFQLPDDPQLAPFRDFLEQFNRGMMPPQGQGRGGQPEQEVYSLGSGFIIDAAGYVVTNNHVIDEADEVDVILQDDTKLRAKIIGRDSKTDLALLKVESKKPLPFVSFGDSDTQKVGDWIIAIGNPFGLGGSVSAGIISARSRSINSGPFDDFLQTDAAINRGNSGGPMFNMEGKVIGINSAILSPSGGNIGIGFAIPSSQAQPIIEQLKKFGRTHRGWLGVKIQEVTDEIAESVGLPKASGALILGISPKSPALKADIKVGDIITRFNDRDVDTMRKLPRIVAETKVGTKVAVEVWRGGKAHTTSVMLGELDESEDQAKAKDTTHNPSALEETKAAKVLGMQLAALDAALCNRFGLAKDAVGILVLDLAPGSEAARQGVRPGDIIIKVNEARMVNMQDFYNVMSRAAATGRSYALVRILRGKDEAFVTLPTKLK
jgi:serine protease Do